MKPEDTKHPRQGKLYLLQQEDAWMTFKSHTVYLEDDAMRDRILAVIDAINDPISSQLLVKVHSTIVREDGEDDATLHLEKCKTI